MRADRHGFTLIELLVVIGIVAATAGVIGLAVRDGSPATALQSGQSSAAAVIAGARGEAALKNVEATLVVDADPASSTFLRALGVATRVTGASVFTFDGDWTVLPAGVYVVPTDTSLAGTSFTLDEGALGNWNVERFSSLTATDIDAHTESGGPAVNLLRLTTAITPLGRADPGGGARLVLAAAHSTGSAVVFGRPEAVRGVLFSAYGAVTFVNEGDAF